MCAAKILGERGALMIRAVQLAHDQGLHLVLTSQTLRHDRSDGLSGLMDALAEGRRSVDRCRPLERLRDELGEVGTIRRTEVTHGANGWHPHDHAFRFFKVRPSDDQIAQMEGLASDAFRRAMRRIAPSWEPSREHGTDWRLLDLTEAAHEVAAYVAKGSYTEAAAERAALELAGTRKLARGANRTPMRLLHDIAATGDADDLTLWWEYEQATKGRRCIEWSRRRVDGMTLAECLAIEDVDLTDEEIAQKGDDQGEDVGVLPWDTWRSLRDRRGAIGHLLGLLGQVAGLDAARLVLEAQLRTWGMEPPITEKPPERIATS